MKRHKVVELASSAGSISTKEKKRKAKYDPEADMEYMEEVTKTALLSLQTEKVQQAPRKREFRTSGLPFCPILAFIKDPQYEEYAKSHYTTTGTAIHESIQAWYSISKVTRDIMYGSWKCTGCQTVKLNQFRPKKPCDCDHKISTTSFHRGWPKHWTYEEIEYVYNGLSGHIDMVLAPRPDFYYVKDFKTTELEKKKRRLGWKEDKVSSPNYVAQIRTYSTILTLEHGLPIRGWQLINTERGTPIRLAQHFHTQVGTWSKEKSLKWQKLLDQSCDNNQRLLKLEQAIADEDSSLAKKYLKRVILNRPCTDDKSYNAYMRYGFYTGECAHKGVCCGGSDKAIFNTVMTELAKKE